MFSSRPAIKEVQHELSCYENVKLHKSNVCTFTYVVLGFVMSAKTLPKLTHYHKSNISRDCTMFTCLYVYFKCYGYHVPCFTITCTSIKAPSQTASIVTNHRRIQLNNPSNPTIKSPGGSRSLIRPNRITCHKLGCPDGIATCDTAQIVPGTHFSQLCLLLLLLLSSWSFAKLVFFKSL